MQMMTRLTQTLRTLTLLSVLAILSLATGTAALAQEESPAGGASPSPAAAASEPALGTPAPGGAMPIPEGGEILEPGRYADTSIGRAFSFEVDDGWTSQGAIPGAGVALIEDTEVGPYVAIVPFDGSVFTDPCLTADNAAAFGPAPTRVDATPEGLLAHLGTHPFLTLTEPVPVEIGGLAGLQVDVTTSVPDDCDPPWAWLWVLPVVNDYHLTEDVAARVIALDGGDSVVALVSEVAAAGDVAALTDRAMTVFESMEFGEPS
jgi:hypothetical protein